MISAWLPVDPFALGNSLRRRPAGFGLSWRDVLLAPGLADDFVDPTEQRVAAATVISTAMIG
jgi:hypothetical protein